MASMTPEEAYDYAVAQIALAGARFGFGCVKFPSCEQMVGRIICAKFTRFSVCRCPSGSAAIKSAVACAVGGVSRYFTNSMYPPHQTADGTAQEAAHC
jgi:hypothetical protein